jgi:hypothetical protein
MTETVTPPPQARGFARIPVGFWLILAIVAFWMLPVCIRYSPLLPHSQQQAYQHDQQVVSSPVPHSDASTNNEQAGQRWQQYLQKRWADLVEVADENDKALVAIGTVVLAVFTAALFFLGYLQLRDTRVLQRSYLSVEPQGIRMLRVPLDHAIANIGIRNVGHLPARKVSWIIKQQFSEDWRLIDRDFPIDRSTAEGNNVIPPGTMMVQGGRQFDATQLVGSPRDLYIYVWGAVFYQDGFNKRRTTHFCHRYNCVNFRVSRIRPDFGRYHRYGNDAD